MISWTFCQLFGPVVDRPYCAYSFTWTFARYSSIISVVCLRKSAISDCVWLCQNCVCWLSVYFYSFALVDSGQFQWIYVVLWLTYGHEMVYCGAILLYFEHLWWIWEDVLSIFSTKRRIWWQNQVGTKESNQTQAKPGLWARFKAQWATQQCSRTA